MRKYRKVVRRRYHHIRACDLKLIQLIKTGKFCKSFRTLHGWQGKFCTSFRTSEPLEPKLWSLIKIVDHFVILALLFAILIIRKSILNVVDLFIVFLKKFSLG